MLSMLDFSARTCAIFIRNARLEYEPIRRQYSITWLSCADTTKKVIVLFGVTVFLSEIFVTLQSENMSAKYEKWSKDQIELLIDAFKDEQCLYASNLPTYRNKHLRDEAIERVWRKVLRLRPTTTKDGCQKKLKNLRNEFKIENAKVKASLQSGTGTDDVYSPNLWYYSLLLFLDTYVTPRKSQNSLVHEQNPVPESSRSVLYVTESQNRTDNLNYVGQQQQLEVFIPVVQSTVTTDAQEDSSSSILLQSNIQNPMFITPGPISPALSTSPASPALSTPSTSENSSRVIQRKSKKRPWQDSTVDDFSGAINNLVESFRQPITVTTSGNTQFSTDPAVNGLLSFVGALLQSFQSEELKLEVMNTISQTVINAKSLDLQRAKK